MRSSKAITLLSMCAAFMPNDRRLDYATKHALPVLLRTGTNFAGKAQIECTIPRLGN